MDKSIKNLISAGASLLCLVCVSSLEATPTQAGTYQVIVYGGNANGLGDYTTATISIANTGSTPAQGLRWASRWAGLDLREIKFGGGWYVGIGYWNGGYVGRTQDGRNWSSVKVTDGVDLYGLAFGDGFWLALAENGSVYRSGDNGTNWSLVGTLPSGSYFYYDYLSLIKNGTQWVAINQRSALRSSDNGVNWTTVATGAQQDLSSVAIGGSMLVAVGKSGEIVTSTDSGASWTRRTSVTDRNLNSVAYGNNRFVAVGDSGIIFTSSDGISWQSQASGTTSIIESVSFGNGVFVRGDNGSVSSDGLAWTTPQQGSASSWYEGSLAYGNAGWLVASGGYTIYQTVSGPVPNANRGSSSGTVGQSFSYQIPNTSGVAATSYFAVNLPPGLSLNPSTGVISGTVVPTAVPVITSAATANGTTGQSFYYQTVATNSPQSYSVVSGNLSAIGLSLDSSTGTILGTPTITGNTIIGLRATNIVGNSLTKNLTISIANVIPIITSASSATAAVGTPFTHQITATNPPILSYSASLPSNSGLSINSTTGLISGTPTIGGNFVLNLTARNSAGNSSVQSFLLQITTPPRTWTSVSSIGNFTTTIGAPSVSRSFTVNGTGITGPVVIQAPVGFEVSTNNSTFSKEVTLGKYGGKIYTNSGSFAALKTDGSVVTWGDAFSGGNSTIVFNDGIGNYTFKSVSSSLNSNVATIYSNGGAFAALKKDGSVVTWGYALSGGNSSITSESYQSGRWFNSETGIVGSLSSNVTMVFSNENAFAALKKDGSVVTWGSGSYGGNSSAAANHLSSNVTAIYSNQNAFAALKRDGSVVTWGDTLSGGNSSISSESYQSGRWFNSETSVVGSLSSNVTMVFANQSAFAALKKDGSVVTWGNDSYGGNSTKVATKLTSNVANIYPIDDAFIALKKDGSVVTWGKDDVYKNGISTTLDLFLGGNITKVVEAERAGAALKKDGTVVVWGSSHAADVFDADLTGIVDVVGGKWGFAALKANGSVVPWGMPAWNMPQAVSDKLKSGVVEILSAGDAFVARKGDGTLVWWGSAPKSQISNGLISLHSNGYYAAVLQNGLIASWDSSGESLVGSPGNLGLGEPPTLPQTIYIRLASANSSGPVSGNVSVSSTGTATQFLSVSGMVNPTSVPVITSNATTAGALNVPFSYQITATNPPILSYSATLPPNSGLSLNSTTGVISGTPTLGGNFTVNLVARNLVGNSTIKQLFLNIVVPPRVWTLVPSIGNFTTGAGSPSAARSFTINGTSLTGPVTIMAPPGFEVSTDNSTFSSAATLGTPGGRIQSVYRGDFNTATGKIWHAGSGREFPNEAAFAAITSNGSVVTWGSRYYGGNSINVAGALSSNVIEVYSTKYAFAAIKKNGSVVTWGIEPYGGNSTSVADALSSNVSEVCSTMDSFAALKKDGSVVTWGDAYGGNSTNVAGALSSNVTEVYSSKFAFAALKNNGSVVTWGADRYGGNSTTVANALRSNVAVIYSTLGAFAALKKDGSVITWGEDSYGGNSTSVSSSLSSNVTKIYSNCVAFAAVKKDGSVVTWGDDYLGGNSTSIANALSSNVTVINSTDGAFAALKKDGSVVTWGADSYGGNSTSVSSSLSSNVTEICSNSNAFAALKKDGSVVTWGSEWAGGDSSSIANALTSNVSKVYSTNDAFAALKKDGSVVTWGADSYGGNSTSVSSSLSSNVSGIYSTEGAFAALKKDGSVVTWGYLYDSIGFDSPIYIGAGGPPSLPATVFTRLAASNQTGAVSGNISISSDGAVTQNVFVSGMVNPSSVPVITSNATANGTLGAPFFYQITATNPPILAYSNSGNLPAGITINGTTGIISGTANATGNFTVNLFARNSAGNSSARRLDIAIAPAPSPQITYFGTQGAVPFEAYNTFAAPVLQVLVFNPSGSAMKYQWYFNGAPIAGATQSTYNMGTASSARVGFYSVLVTNAAIQSVSSPNLEFSLKPSAAFSVSGPVNQRFSLGSNATYAVTDLGLPPGNATVTYQWLKNGVVIPSATGVSYTIPNGVSASTAGAYAVQITTKIGNIVIGTVVSKSWSVALQDLGILIYNLAGNATRTSGANETVGTISGYFLIDRANDNAAIIQTYGSGFAKRNSLEMRPDIAAASTGPVVGSRTVFAGSLNSGDVPVGHDMSWITGRDEEVTIATATTSPSVLPALKVFAPSSMTGTLGTLARELSSVEIDSFSVTLTINKPLTTTAIRNNHTLEQAILATRAAANAAGFIDDASTPTPSTNMVLVQGGTIPQNSELLPGEPVATFRIGKYEVTWDEWQEVRTWAIANGYSDLAGIGEGRGGNHPVQNVSWYDVLKWCNAKSQKEGLMPVYNTSGAIYKTGQTTPTINPVSNGYRLPREAEWEWAARGGVFSQGYTYSGSNDLNSVAWNGGNSDGGPRAVGTKAPNELEIHDMSGNVWEWCWEAKDDARYYRGGHWSGSPVQCSLFHHSFSYPFTRSEYVGFRLARFTGE